MTEPSPPPPNFNPYAAPTVTAEPEARPGTPQQWEEIRRRHITHEVSLRSYGALILLGSLFLIWVSATGIYEQLQLMQRQEMTPIALLNLGVIVFSLALTVVYLVAGFGLRQLTFAGRVAGTLVGLVMLLAVPFGTLLGAYLLYLLWSPKSQMIFSPEYREIRAATPHVRCRTSPVVWVLVVILLGLMSIGLVGLVMG